MSQSITNYVDVQVALAGQGPQPAGFGVPMFMHEHALESARLAGPFTSAADVTDAGHASGSPPHLYAQALASQQPRASSFYVGRADSGDADVGVSFDAILAENTGAWYCAHQESRADQDILDFAAAVEAAAFPKIAIQQSSAESLLSGDGPAFEAQFGGTPTDGDYDLVFTGFGLVSPVTVTVTRVGSVPVDDDALAVAMDTALDTAAAGSLLGVVDPASVLAVTDTVAFDIIDGLASGTVTSTPPSPGTLTVTRTDADVGSALQALGYLRSALIYHPTDTEYLDGAWAARCLSFNLDQRRGNWYMKRVVGVPGTSLTNAQVAALRAANVNYFAPAVSTAGVPIGAFTAQGWMSGGDASAGRRIDITTSLDWGKARMEEGLLGVLLRETHEVPYNDAGINRFVASASNHFGVGKAAGHYLADYVVPEGEDREGTTTPAIFAPTIAETTVVERTARVLTFESLVYLQASIEAVQYNVEVRQ